MAELANPPAAPARDVVRLADSIARRWRAGEEPDTAAVLRRYPEIAGYRSVVVDLAYEEYLVAEESGRSLSASELCEQLPEYAGSIRRVVEGHRLAAEKLAATAEPLRWPRADDVVEGIELLGEFGRGSFARVYLGFDPSTERTVVLKFIPGRSREGKASARVRHPHIAEIYWSKPHGDFTAICMPFAGTATLGDLRDLAFPNGTFVGRGVVDLLAESPSAGVQASSFAVPEKLPYALGILAISARVADALAHLHSAGVCHGDLKPTNVVLGPAGHPYLIDFNLASVGEEGTLRGGTLAYMPPEQLRNLVSNAPHSPFRGHAADVYSFGATLFEMLCGSVPYPLAEGASSTGEAARSILARMESQSLPPLPNAVPIPAVPLLRSCLSANPQQRPSAAEVAARIAAILSPIRPNAGFRRAALIGMGLLCGGGSALAVGTWHRYSTAQQAEAEPITHEEFFERGRARAERGEFVQAALDFTKALRRSPESRYFAWLGYAQVKSELTDLAIPSFREARNRGDRSAEVANDLAACLAVRSQFREAKELLDEAIRIDPRLPEARRNRARALLSIAGELHTKRLSETVAAEDIGAFLAQAREIGSEDYYLAAVVFAQSSHLDPSYAARCVDCIRRSIECGRNPAEYRLDLASFAGVSHRRDFASALATPRGPKTNSVHHVLVPPK